MIKDFLYYTVGIAILLWGIYIAASYYWISLLSETPSAVQGEISGPAFYFIPRLFYSASVTSVIALGLAIAQKRIRT
jgi:hypothetical protein